MSPHSAEPLLVVEDVHAAYGKKKILQGVSLTVARGEIVALLGGNGSGKSTLLKTIGGLLLPLQGKIEFDGRDITRVGVHVRQRLGVGFLLQGARVFPNLTVAENFEVAMKHHRNGYTNKIAEPGRIFPVLRDKTGIRAGLLSGGQRQMLAVETVLAQEPVLALLDEPTAALSRDAVAHILDAVKEFARRSGSGVLLVEQNVHYANQIATRQLRLTDGRIGEAPAEGRN